MDHMMSEAERQARQEFRAFVDEYIVPFANEWDHQQIVPDTIIKRLSELGYLGGIVPVQYGGKDMDAIMWSILCEEVSRGSASLLSLLTVHGMVCQALIKWGTPRQKKYWLPLLAKGERIGAFALTEPNAGSDAGAGESFAEEDADGWRITGQKRWISFGQVANLMLVMAKVNGKMSAFLVERGATGFSTKPIKGMLGFRSAMLADVFLEGCWIPSENLIGSVGFGLSHVVGAALDHGRFSISWGSLGLARAALEASLSYSRTREQFGVPLRSHQLIQELISDMVADISAARALCNQAAHLRKTGDPAMIMETSVAKYFASRIAVKATGSAVQIHGANGCSEDYPVQRYFRDAKIMEIIEGSSQMQQIIIAEQGEHALRFHKSNSIGGKA